MVENERKKILIVDTDLPHIDAIGKMLRECNPALFVDLRPEFSFVNFNPKEYDAIFVCSGYLQDCRLNLLDIKSREEAKKLKIFALFEESICPSSDEEYFRENGIDGFLSLPFSNKILNQQLAN